MPLTRRRLEHWGDWSEAITARGRVRVRHHALALAPTSHSELVVCGRGGWIVVEDDAGRTETHGVRPYDVVSAADGSSVAAGHCVLRRHRHREVLVACVPEGERATVRLRHATVGDTLREELDASTGSLLRFVTRSPWSRGATPAIELVPHTENAFPSITLPLPDGAELRCAEGDEVTRGDVLAWSGRFEPAGVPILGGDEALRALLDGAIPHGTPRAVVAPVSGQITLRDLPRNTLGIAHDDQRTVVRRPRRAHDLLVFEGMWVNAGDPLTDGAIDHRDLARALGVADFVAHVREEMQELFALQGIEVPDTMCELVAASLVAHVTVTDPGDTSLAPGQRLRREALPAGAKGALRFEPLSARVRRR